MNRHRTVNRELRFSIASGSLVLLMVAVGLAGMAADSAHAQSTGSRVRGALNLRGRLRILGNQCTLVVTPTANQKRVRVRCNGSAPKRLLRNTRGIVYLKNRQTAVIDARNCFLRVATPSQRRVDLTCTARLNPVPTPIATTTATPTSTATPNPDANALVNGNILLAFNADSPAGATAVTSVTGLNGGDNLVSIDRRPQNGQLYGLGYNSGAGTVQLYAISSESGVAKAVGSTGTFVESDGTTPVAIGNDAGTRFGMDFNPAVDRIRIVTSDSAGSGPGQNFRMNPNTGAFVDGDLGGSSGSVPGLNMDGAINGSVTTVQETAYTNNTPNTAVVTQYTVDAGSDQLCIQNPPNSGTQTQCLAFSQPLDTLLGFDIPAGIDAPASNSPVSSGTGYLLAKQSGSQQEVLVSLSLNSGQITSSSPVGASQTGMLGLAIQRPGAARIVALSADGTQLLRFSSSTPGSVVTASISGVNAGETLTGLDIRPATGQYYSLGIDEVTDTGTLYVIDPQTGTAVAVGTPGSISFVDTGGSPIELAPAIGGYGFDFNPTVDRVRVVSSSGLNFRLVPDTGVAVDSDAGATGTQPDGNLNGSTTGADGAAYTNSSAGQAVTTLYVIDAASDGIYIQNPPNNGTLSAFRAVTLSGSTLDFTAVSGFDIRPDVRVTDSNVAVSTGSAYAALTVGGVTGLYLIDLNSGSTTSLGVIGTGVTGLGGIAVSTSSIR